MEDKMITPSPEMNVLGNGERIAATIETCDWSGSPIGNKEILKAAVVELRSGFRCLTTTEVQP